MAQGQFQSAATGNWGNSSSWTLISGSDADGVPDSDDDVEIISGHTITLTANAAANQLTVTNGNVSIGSYELDIASNISGSGNIEIDNGTLYSQADISISSLSVNSNATINIGGDWDIPDGGYSSSTSELVVFNGTTDQHITTPLNASFYYINELEVNKPSGTLYLNQNYDIVEVKVTTGTIDLQSVSGWMDYFTVKGGTAKLSSSSSTVFYTVALNGGILEGDSGTLVMDGAQFDITGGTFNYDTSTIRFEGGSTSDDISSNQDLDLYNIHFNRSGDALALTGIGSQRTFTIHGTLEINQYDDGRGRNAPLSLSNATLAYHSSGVLNYNRSSGIPQIGDEWPAGGIPNLHLGQGNVTLSTSKQVNTKLTRIDGSISGTVTYASGATLLYDPGTNSDIAIGDEWPTSSGPENVSINHSGYSITSNSDQTVPGTLTLTSGTIDLSGNTLIVQGSVIGSEAAGSGLIADATTLAMGDGASSTRAQSISGALVLNKLVINKSGGATLSDNTVTLTGALTFTNSGLINVIDGHLDLNGKTVDISAGGSTLQVQSGASLRTQGTSISDFSSYAVSAGKIIFGNSNNVEIIPSGITIGIMEVNGDGGIQLSTGVLNVQNEIIFTNGLITTTATKSLRTTPTTTLTGASASSYVAGPMQVSFSGTASADYPIGNATDYRPAQFSYTAFSSGGGSSVIEIQQSTQSFSSGTLPDDISAIDPTSHYLITEKGTLPSSYTYTLTATFEADNFTPESRNRILVQSSGTPTWIYPDEQSVDQGANQVTATGLTSLPSDDGWISFGAGGIGLYFTNSANDNDWFNANNWSSGSIPTSADSVIISSGLSVTLGDASSDGGMQTIKELILESSSSMTISSANSEGIALLVGDGADADSVIQIHQNASLTISGGSNRSLSLKDGSEIFYNDGSVIIDSGTGIGTGTTGSILPTSRQIHTANSAYTFKIAASNFQAQTYGDLTLEPQGGGANDDKIRLNQSLEVQGDYLQSGGQVTFVDGSTNGESFNVDGSLTLTSNAQFTASDGASGTNDFMLGKDLAVGSNAAFNVGTNINFKLDGDGDQTISSAITSLTNLDVSGSGNKTLSGNLQVANQLNMDGGVLDTDTHTLTLGTGVNSPGTLNHTTGTIAGKLKRWVPTSTSDLLFPVGNNTGESVSHRPARIQFPTNAPDNGGTLTVSFIESDPGTDGLPLTDSSDSDYSIENASTMGFWRVSTADGMEDPNEDFEYNIELTAAAFTGISDVSALHLIKRETSGDPWDVLGTHESATTVGGDPVIKRSGLTGFSEFTVGSGDENTLPVSLISFQANTYDNSGHPQLKWKTATERENYGFYVERWNPAQEQWKELSFVDGAGTTTQSQSYTYRDTTLQEAGNYSYRLRQVDYDGAFEMHGPVLFQFEAPQFMRLQSNYPNPFNPTTIIPYQLSQASEVHLAVYDMTGRRVALLVDEPKQPGQYKVSFNGEQLASGLYLIRFVADGQQFTRKITLIK
ncbi:MAG: T9SS type A sorting domain-containing protein [Bacteroidota bacterium]